VWRFATAETLEPQDRKMYLRTLRYPARFCSSWITGRMGSNDEAVAFLGKTPPARLDLGLITRGLQCRQAGADPDSLFPAQIHGAHAPVEEPSKHQQRTIPVPKTSRWAARPMIIRLTI
jgi:hypothetical protein